MWRDCARRALSAMSEERHNGRPGPGCGLNSHRVATGRRTGPRGLLLMGAAVLATSCGGSGPTDADRVERRSEFVLASAPAGLEQAVAADSIAWAPGIFHLVGDGELEIEGTYRIVFRSLTERPLELRYDLRFLDADGIFVDIFIPFGLPLRLEPGDAQAQEGTFTIRSRDLAYPELLATMQVVAAATEVAAAATEVVAAATETED